MPDDGDLRTGVENGGNKKGAIYKDIELLEGKAVGRWLFIGMWQIVREVVVHRNTMRG